MPKGNLTSKCVYAYPGQNPNAWFWISELGNRVKNTVPIFTIASALSWSNPDLFWQLADEIEATVSLNSGHDLQTVTGSCGVPGPFSIRRMAIIRLWALKSATINHQHYTVFEQFAFESWEDAEAEALRLSTRLGTDDALGAKSSPRRMLRLIVSMFRQQTGCDNGQNNFKC